MTHKVWQRDFDNLANAVADAGMVIDLPDGTQAIAAEHANSRLVRLYGELCSIGYAKGWL